MEFPATVDQSTVAGELHSSSGRFALCSSASPLVSRRNGLVIAELIRKHVPEPTQIWHVGPDGAVDEDGNPLLG
jgi:hypothetical protein